MRVEELGVETDDARAPVGDGAGDVELDDAADADGDIALADDARLGVDVGVIQTGNRDADVGLLDAPEDGGLVRLFAEDFTFDDHPRLP